MKTLQQIINECIENVIEQNDKTLVQNFDVLYATMDESQKSNLVRILIGKGAITVGKDGKLQKNKEKGDKIKKELGIK